MGHHSRSVPAIRRHDRTHLHEAFAGVQILVRPASGPDDVFGATADAVSAQRVVDLALGDDRAVRPDSMHTGGEVVVARAGNQASMLVDPAPERQSDHAIGLRWIVQRSVQPERGSRV